MEPFIAEIIMFGGNFAPRGWAFCNGQLLPINQNTALFSILGTTYGGDGRTTFGLPDLRGRASIHPGNGPGLTQISLGEKSGQENVTLSINELPSHTHSGAGLKGTITCNEEDGNSEDPQVRNIGVSQTDTPYNSNINDKQMTANAVAISGQTAATGAQKAFNIRNPYLGINYIIALQGIFPSRS